MLFHAASRARGGMCETHLPMDGSSRARVTMCRKASPGLRLYTRARRGVRERLVRHCYPTIRVSRVSAHSRGFRHRKSGSFTSLKSRVRPSPTQSNGRVKFAMGIRCKSLRSHGHENDEQIYSITRNSYLEL